MDSEALKPCPQDHWTVKGAIQAARMLLKAGDDLSFMAQISGGTAGRDAGLCATIAHWTAERDKVKQMLRIIELEGDDPEIGAGILSAEPRPTPADDGLVRRLRDEAERNGGQGSYAWCSRELCGKAADRIEALQAQLANLDGQIDRLANYIMHKVDGEPSENQGAVDTAIRIMKTQTAQLAAAKAELARKDAALVLAANRLHRCSVEFIADDNQGPLRWDASLWADEASAALGEPT